MERGSFISVKNKWIAQILSIDYLVGTREANYVGKKSAKLTLNTSISLYAKAS